MISQEYEGNRTIYNRHGVRIVATCGGSFASWDVFSAFNLFASAGAMIGLATMVVDRLVVRSPFSCEDGVCGFCKYTKFYKSAKYQRTYVKRLAMVAQCPLYTVSGNPAIYCSLHACLFCLASKHVHSLTALRFLAPLFNHHCREDFSDLRTYVSC